MKRNPFARSTVSFFGQEASASAPEMQGQEAICIRTMLVASMQIEQGHQYPDH